MEYSSFTNLKAEWFKRFDQILIDNAAVPSSNLKCMDLCEARCCPQVGMRQLTPDKVASPTVVLLPFEMEYIIERTGIDRSHFRVWPIDLTPEVRIEIGMFDVGKPCPFLLDNRLCGIHTNKPLDCNTFPLLPSLDANNRMEWSLGEKCPSLSFLSPNFSEKMKDIWQNLEPVLPRAWWDIYHFAEHWTGWPSPKDVYQVIRIDQP